MRVLVDSNVIISIFAFGSFPELYESFGCEGTVALFPSYCIDEVRRVVGLKWPARSADLERFLDRAAFEEVPDPGAGGSGLDIRDPADLPVLRAAVAGRADAIVTGDKDFAAADTGGVPVYTPAAFIAEFL